MCLACCGSEDGCDILVCDVKAASVRVFVDGDGLVLGDLEVVRSRYDADHGRYRAECFVLTISSVCDFLSVIQVLLAAPCYDNIVDLGAPACLSFAESSPMPVEEHEVLG